MTEDRRSRSPEAWLDLGAAMAPLRYVIASRTLSQEVIEDRLGWPRGYVAEMLARPEEARLADYLRVMREVATMVYEGAVETDPTLADPVGGDPLWDVGADRRAGARAEITAVPKLDESPLGQQLRMLEFHFVVLQASIATGQVDGDEVLASMPYYEALIRRMT